MRIKKLQLLLTFRTTSDALATEKALLSLALPGRLIPVPAQISAGCGLAWCAPLEAREATERALLERQLTPQSIQEYLL